MARGLPDLSRFEWQCLKLLWERGEASVRQIHDDLRGAPSYSTVRKIVERLEEKRAVERVRLEGKAWVYRPAVSRAAMVRREVRRFLESVFDGSATPLVAQLADMDALSLEDLRALEARLGPFSRGAPSRGSPPGGGRRGRTGASRRRGRA